MAPLDLSSPPSQLSNSGVPLLDLDLASLHTSLVLSISPSLPLSHSLPTPSPPPLSLPPVAREEPVHQSSSLASLAHRLLHRLPKHNNKVQDIQSGATGTLYLTFTNSWMCVHASTNCCILLQSIVYKKTYICKLLYTFNTFAKQMTLYMCHILLHFHLNFPLHLNLHLHLHR